MTNDTPVQPAFVSLENAPDSPKLAGVVTGDQLHHLSAQSLRITLPTPSSTSLLDTPPSTPPPCDNKSLPLLFPPSGLSPEQQIDYVDSLSGRGRERLNQLTAEEDSGSDQEVEAEKNRILSGHSSSSESSTADSPPPAYAQPEPSPQTPVDNAASAAAATATAQLLPSHMQRTARSALSRPSIVRMPSHLVVSFADQLSDSPPTSPKGHPTEGQYGGFPFYKYVDVQKHLKNVEHSKAKLLGYLGGGGSGVPLGLKGSLSELQKGKIFRPTPSAHPTSTLKGEKFRTTISHLARIPRKYRPILASVICFILFFSVLMGWSSSRSEHERQLASKRYARGLQKAYVIGKNGIDISAHPSLQSDPDRLDQVQDSQLFDALNSADIAAAPQDVEVIPPPARWSFEFKDKHEEMAALVSFLTSSSSNALPTIDPSVPLDPQLVLDFDYTKQLTARGDMEQLTEDVFSLFPTIIAGKMRDPQHRAVLRTLAQYVMDPPPLVIEVDQRMDYEQMVPLLARLLDTDVLPQVIVNGKAAGGHKDILQLQKDGQVKKYFSNLGIKIKDRKLKKKPKYAKDAERRENERILGPKPIEGAHMV